MGHRIHMSQNDQSAVQPVHNAMLDRMISANGEPLSAKAGLMWVCLAKFISWFDPGPDFLNDLNRRRNPDAPDAHVMWCFSSWKLQTLVRALPVAKLWASGPPGKSKREWTEDWVHWWFTGGSLVVHWWFTGKRWNWHNFTKNWKLEMESFNT